MMVHTMMEPPATEFMQMYSRIPSESGAYNVTVNAIVQKNGRRLSPGRLRPRSGFNCFRILSVTDADIAFSNNSPEHGEMVTITATIHNIGDADASDVKVLFFDGDPAESGIAIGEANIDLSAGNETDVSVPLEGPFPESIQFM